MADQHPAAKPLEVVTIAPPPVEQRVQRDAQFVGEGEKRTRYALPRELHSSSPVGYRTRISLTEAEARAAMPLLALEPATSFIPGEPLRERELFEESSLGVLVARQSTNYRGHRQVTVGPDDVPELCDLLQRLADREGEVVSGAGYAHVVFSRPYRTPFTLLLTFVGHKPVASLATVPLRAWRKRRHHTSDIPTIAYLTELHVGILVDTLERAVVVASEGKRRAQTFMRPFSGEAAQRNRSTITAIGRLCGLTPAQRASGWRVAAVALVGDVPEADRIELPDDVDAQLWRKIGANLLAFRSERIQPGVNAEPKAPPQYQTRQDMDVSEAFTYMVGRAGFNAFTRWTGLDRERAKELMLLERVDVLTPGGKERLRAIRKRLEAVTDRVVKDLPRWIELPTAKLLSRNAERGRKAFALAGQRIYLLGLSRGEVEAEGLDWEHAIRAVGAAACRAALYAEMMGATAIPEGCDLLAGICMMAGPVNQADVGKTFFDQPDLLEVPHPDRDPTSLLVWTLKAKTVADPVGNEEQLLNPSRKGALVDLRPGPHQAVFVRRRGGALEPLRSRNGKVNDERAFGDQGNYVRAPDGAPIPGNEGEAWPDEWADTPVW